MYIKLMHSDQRISFLCGYQYKIKFTSGVYNPKTHAFTYIKVPHLMSVSLVIQSENVMSVAGTIFEAPS